MKRKQAILFILLVLMLFALNKFFMSADNVQISEVPDMVNHDHISSQRLFDNTWNIIKDNYYDAALNHQDWSRWKSRYHGQIKTMRMQKLQLILCLQVLMIHIQDICQRLNNADQNSSINSKITGIGVNITSISGKVHIVNVMEGTPAQFANLLPDDIILAIDGKEVNGLPLSEVANLVRGPENTFVNVTVLRNKDKLVKKVMRKEIKIKTVKSSVLDRNIGYIQITSFIGSTTPNEFLEALEKLKMPTV